VLGAVMTQNWNAAGPRFKLESGFLPDRNLPAEQSTRRSREISVFVRGGLEGGSLCSESVVWVIERNDYSGVTMTAPQGNED
jgi:hypothetical protein